MSDTRHHGASGVHTAARAPDAVPLHYARHRPEQTTLYRLVQQHAASFIAHTEAATGSQLQRFIKDEFDAFLECGILAHGFLRLRCGECGHDRLLAFSCKRRGFCPSCGARRMSQTAANLVDHVIPQVPVRQWAVVAAVQAEEDVLAVVHRGSRKRSGEQGRDARHAGGPGLRLRVRTAEYAAEPGPALGARRGAETRPGACASGRGVVGSRRPSTARTR